MTADEFAQAAANEANSLEGMRAALAAAWGGDWSILIRRLRDNAPLVPIEREVLAEMLNKLVDDGALRVRKGWEEAGKRFEIALYVNDLRRRGVNKNDAVIQAEDRFDVSNALVWKACREFDENVWVSPLDWID